MLPSSVPLYRELPIGPGELYPNAWGVFGADDQIGTLNHLTPERTMAALASVRSGAVLNLNLPLDAFDPPLISHRGLPKHDLFGLNQFHRDDKLDGLFMQASTQLDGLRHFAHPDKGFYNGFAPGQITSDTEDLGIHLVAQRGIAGRGVLVDVGRYLDSVGAPLDQASNQQISVSQLDAALAHQGSIVLPGDILLIRTGWLSAIRSGAVVRTPSPSSPGLAQSEQTAAWLWDKQVAVAAADNIALESWPAERSTLTTRAESNGELDVSNHTGMLHRLLIPLLGLTIGELWDLDQLAEECFARDAYDFFVVAEPLYLRGGVGSPANAIAIL